MAWLTALAERAKKYGDGRGIAAGTMSSLLVRGAGVVNTIIAMPIALHTLGDLRFGTFLLLFGVISWLLLGNFGVQNALGRAIAAKTLGTEEIPHVLGAALIYAAVTTLATAILVYFGYRIWVSTVGVHLHLPLGEVTTAAAVMIALTGVQMILQVFEGIRIGELKLYVLNLIRLSGSIFGFACLIVLPHFWSSMTVFVIALNGGPLIATILNAVIVMRDVRPNFGHIGRNLGKLQSLATSGFAFLIIGAASLFETHVPVLILSSIIGPVGGIDFGLFIRLLFVLFAGLTMLTTPLWPALLAARADADKQWLRKTLRISGLLVVGAGLIACLAVAFFGTNVIFVWTGHRLTEPPVFKYLFGLFFIQTAWSHYWTTVLIGLGKEHLVSVIVLVEGIVMCLLGTLLCLQIGSTGMILGMCLGFLLISNWLLPVIVDREIHWSRSLFSSLRLAGVQMVRRMFL